MLRSLTCAGLAYSLASGTTWSMAMLSLSNIASCTRG